MPKEKDEITIMVEDDGGLIAFIWWNNPANEGCVECYSHIGQHSEATLEYAHDTRGLRTIEEIEKAQALISELRSIGYNI